MTDGRATSERLLRLLALLQARAAWTGRELAAELGVTDRCVRRDVQRLRDLGYPIEASQGVGGGYRFGGGGGTALPPLLLDPSEVVATTAALILAAGTSLAGADEAALRTLAKLDQVMSPRLRAEVQALQEATDTLRGAGNEPTNERVEGDVLMRLARATRDRVRVRLRYAAVGREPSERRLEPAGLVATGRRWYLLAFDLDRDDWRTFRLDRVADVEATTWRFSPRPVPGGSVAGFVQRAVTAGPYRHVARARLRLSEAGLRALVPPATATVEPDPRGESGWSLLVSGGHDLDLLALHLARFDVEVDVLEPEGLREAAGRMAARLAQVAGFSPDAGSAPPAP